MDLKATVPLNNTTVHNTWFLIAWKSVYGVMDVFFFSLFGGFKCMCTRVGVSVCLHLCKLCFWFLFIYFFSEITLFFQRKKKNTEKIKFPRKSEISTSTIKKNQRIKWNERATVPAQISRLSREWIATSVDPGNIFGLNIFTRHFATSYRPPFFPQNWRPEGV